MDTSRRALERVFILLIDILAITISMVVAYFIRYHNLLLRTEGGAGQVWVYALAVVVYAVVFFLFGNQDHFFQRSLLREFLEVLKNVILTLLLMLTLLYMMYISDEVSRLVIGYLAVIWTVLMFFGRLGLKQYMTKVYQKSTFSSRMLLIIDSAEADRVLDNIISYNEWNREVSGIVLTDVLPQESVTTNIQESGTSDTKENTSVNFQESAPIPPQDISRQTFHGIPVVCHTNGLVEYALHHNVDEVFFFEGTVIGEEELCDLVSQLKAMGVIVNVNIEEFSLTHSGKRALGRVGKYAVVSFERNAFSLRGKVAKRLLDITGSLVGMIILALVSIVLAPAIKLDSPGPVFFGQIRVGKNGRKFTFYKFRSMYQDAEQRKAELLEQNEVKGLMFKMEDDPRITRVGRFIRRTSLDELPQFWNILKGDMSLVGTRPPTVDEYEQYQAQHKCRLSMTPGLTGMWQISGRSDIRDFDEVVKLDMAYIDNWTIWKDIRILLKTVGVVFTGKGSR